MKRIIDISEEDYKRFISYKSNKYAPTIHQVDTLMLAVANSTPLTECEAEDCISREATKQAIREKFSSLADRCEINEVLNSMPSVYPKSDKSVDYEKCPYYTPDIMFDGEDEYDVGYCQYKENKPAYTDLLKANTQLKKQIEMLKLDRDCDKPSEADDYISKADFVEQIEKTTIGLQPWQKSLIYQVMDDLPTVYPKNDKLTQMIDKSNFSQDQYKADTQSAYDCGYTKAITDALNAMCMECSRYQNGGKCSKCEKYHAILALTLKENK